MLKLLSSFLLINFATQVSSQVELYQKFEDKFEVSSEYNNLYDYDEVAVTASFTSPSNLLYEVDGFYIEDFDIDTVTGALQPLDDGLFALRFAPNEIGIWQYEVILKDSTGIKSLKTSSFECIDIQSARNHGFVKTDSSNYLRFDDGVQYILNGENMAWQSGNIVTSYRAWVGRLAQFGGNFIRLWHAHWGLGIEWKNGFSNFGGLKNYNQIKSRYQDWLYDYCESKGVYAMVCIQHHGQVSTNVNPNWDDSPYNLNNGGPCANTWDFFTDSTAISTTKNRLRYIVARWGYSKNIMAWELFNEVEWTDNYGQHREDIAEWHYEMSSYLKTIDPYKRIVTTSYAEAGEDPMVWQNENIDITQTHYYTNIPNIERVVAKGIRQYLNDYEKPTLNGEFGLGGSANLAKEDVDGIHLHNSMWAALLSGSIGTSMTWWWDSYIHPFDLYFHYEGIDRYTRKIPFADKNLKPTVSNIENVPGSLAFTPNAGWAASSTDTIQISSTGAISPEFYDLGLYLYGSVWNTQHRNPPVFEVNYQDTGYFELKTASDKGSNPRISIMIDTFLITEAAGVTDSTYTIKIPPGKHFISVDNPGIDWISISEYVFSDLGSGLDSYVLKNRESNYATGWVFNHEYNHKNIEDMVEIPLVSGGILQIPDFENGNYNLSWIDCLSGEIVFSESIVVENSSLRISIPDLLWDLSFVVDTEELVFTDDEVTANFALFPNPAIGGINITISGLENVEISETSLIDMSGRVIFQKGNLPSNNFLVPQLIVPGIYWVRILLGDGSTMVKPLSVVD